ncbi:DUF3892 domain-containing protein [Serinibacter salmoneus]|uniref:Uncharacterized protein DUF3892 n=1 Tax=Serinibacter salmoneus TaxID=556530 RepID=A0A2A9D491_9MICO|nr:DUF3892 domain-containing protein [Serinibacter salmoneus]PFG20669.1 uncharacterized protein DUF3892 [Serinibacter salmoneus]
MNTIERVRMSEPGSTCEHITYVRFRPAGGGTTRFASREQVHAWIQQGRSFRTEHPVTGASAQVDARVSPAGTRYIATVANGRETDNLLTLPYF